MPGYRISAPYFGEGEFAEHVDRMKDQPGPSASAFAILGGLQRLPHVYAGTVDPVTVQQRRRKNRRARWARRGNASAIARDDRLHRQRRRFARGQAPELNLGGVQ